MTFKLSRRSLLRGAGVSVGLPLLDAMFDDRALLHGVAGAQSAANPVRLVTYFIPNGVPLHYPGGRADQNLWFPTTTGADYAMTRCLEPIAAYRDRIQILNGVVLGEACADGHAGGTTGFATGLVATTSGSQGPSIDQVAAAALGEATRFRSLGVGVKPVDTPFNDFNIATFDEISWSKADQVEPLRRDPAQLFQDLFAGFMPGDNAAAERRKRYRQSVLDFVQGDVARLQARLGRSDNLRLDAHLGAIRELEKRVSASTTVDCQLPIAPMTEGLGYVDKAKLQAELLAMALKCDLTRYAAYMYGHGGNDGGGHDAKYGLTEVGGEWPQQHNFTHALPDAGKYDSLFDAITRFTLVHMEVFAHFLNTLQEGSADARDFLTDTLIYFGSELGNGVNHDNAGNVLPVLLVGNAGGKLAAGQHLKFASPVRSAKVLLSALQLADVPATEFAGTRETITL